MSAIKDQLTRSANNAVLYVDDIAIGDAVGIQINENTGLQPVRVIGDIRAKEHIHSAISVSISISRIVFRDDVIAQLNISKVGLVNSAPVNIELTENLSTGLERLALVVDVTFGERGISVSPNDTIKSNVSGQGRYILTDDDAEAA